MNISRPFILRPVATTLSMIAMLLCGLIAYKWLPVSSLPEVDYPTIQTTTFYPGASPEVMAALVTSPLERQFGQMPGLRQMSSSSTTGASSITLQFSLSLPLDVAEQQVQAAINAASNVLPKELPAPPIYNKVNPADAAVMTLAITSPTVPLPQVRDLVDTRMAQKISQVSGVGLVTIAGGQRPAMRIQANPQALAAYGLALADVRTAVVASNVNQPKGTLDGPMRSTTIDANDQLRNPADFRNLIVAYRNEAPLRLGDVAEVVLDAEDSRLAAWANQQPAILLNVQRQPGANVIEVVDRIQKLLPQLRAALPGNLDVTVMSDRTQTIRASVKDVQVEMLIAIGLVVLVTFVFLRTLTATLIPSIVVPLSLIGTFGIMYLMDFSVNNLTLMALTIATGFVVDDAIVMIENIARYLERGEKPLQAALKGASQIGFTLVSLTLSLIAVLIPLLFMTEVVGRLFREFALTLAVAIFLSLIISLTLTPMMCARFLRAGNEQKYGWIARKTNGWIEALIRSYARGLKIVLRHQTLTLFVALGTFVLTALLYLAIPKGFFPAQDTGLIQLVTQAPQNLSFDAMSRRQQEAVGVILKDSTVASVASFIGIDGINETVNTGRIQIALRPHNERSENVTQVIRRLENELSLMTDLRFYFQPVQDLTVEDRVSRTQYQLTLEAADASLLAQWVPKLVDQLRAQPELTGVVDDLQEDGLNTFIHIDRDAAARLVSARFQRFLHNLISTVS
jgi:multidrug efflux pump